MSEKMEVDPSRKGKDPQPSGSRGTALRTETGKSLPRGVSKETHKIKNGAIALYALGDSHLRKGHYFPEAYAEARAAGRTDQRFSAVNRKLTWEREGSRFADGYRLDEAYYKQILDLIEDNRGRATAFFLSAGTNDLRAAKESGLEEEVDALMGRFKALMRKIMETPGTVLCILEPIPCSRGIQEARDRLDTELEAECRRHKKVRYIGLTHGENPEIIKINGAFHQDQFWEDDIHLNETGAKLIVKQLIRALGKMDSEFFLMDRDARAIRPPIKRGPPGPPQFQPEHEPQGPSYYKNHDQPRSFKPKMTGPPNRSGEQADHSWKKPRTHPFEDQATSRGSVHRRLGYFTSKDEGLPSYEHRARAEKAPLHDPRLNRAYYCERRTAAMKAYETATDAAKAVYDAAIKKIDEAEKERKPVEEEEVIEPPTPYCRPYEEPRYDGQGPGGPGGFGSFGSFGGFGGYGTPGPFGNMPPPMMFYGYPYIPPRK
jgi:lysophospholipase L1-like esterase